jgi:hypothetical protein
VSSDEVNLPHTGPTESVEGAVAYRTHTDYANADPIDRPR